MTMRDCGDGEMRDLLPDFVHQTLAAPEQARVSAHVALCAECAAEVALLRAIGTAFPAPPLDLFRIVAALPAPRRAPMRWAGVTARPWRFAAAATFVAVTGISLAVFRGTFSTAGNPAAPAAHAVSAIDVRSSRPTTRSAGESLAVGPTLGNRASGLTFDGGLADLTDQQVQTLLGEIDALDAKPNAEPENPVGNIVPVREGESNET